MKHMNILSERISLTSSANESNDYEIDAMVDAIIESIEK